MQKSLDEKKKKLNNYMYKYNNKLEFEFWTVIGQKVWVHLFLTAALKSQVCITALFTKWLVSIVYKLFYH